MGKQAAGMFFQGLGQNAFESLIIAFFLEERQARDGSVENMVNEAARGNAGFARHAPKLLRKGAIVNEKELRPLFLPVFRLSCVCASADTLFGLRRSMRSMWKGAAGSRRLSWKSGIASTHLNASKFRLRGEKGTQLF
jgi:hypothetical protein